MLKKSGGLREGAAFSCKSPVFSVSSAVKKAVTVPGQFKDGGDARGAFFRRQMAQVGLPGENGPGTVAFFIVGPASAPVKRIAWIGVPRQPLTGAEAGPTLSFGAKRPKRLAW